MCVPMCKRNCVRTLCRCIGVYVQLRVFVSVVFVFVNLC